MDISVSALILYRLLEQRFRTPITVSECEKRDKSWVADASRRKWAWVLKVFEEWKTEQRNEAFLKQDCSGEPVIQEDIDEMSDEVLDCTLARFVAEVRMEDGRDSPGKTLYETLSSIQMFLRVQCKRNITLIDNKLQYNKLCSTLSVSVIAFVFSV